MTALPGQRAAILAGFGRMGRILADAILALPERPIRVVTVAEPGERARAEATALFGSDTRTTADFATALAAGGADCCIIAAPTPLHAGLVESALAAGLQIFCEKPLSFDPATDLRLAAEAERRGLVLQLGFFHRFATPWVKAREALRNGAIGPLRFVRGSCWDKVVPALAFCDPAVSGGLVVDNGIHEIDALEWISGQRVVRVAARHGRDAGLGLGNVGDVDCAALLLELDGGAVATIDVSRNACYADDIRTEILGRDGALFVDYVPISRARVGTAAGVTEIPGSRVDDGYVDGVREELRAFARAASGGSLDIPGGRDSARAIRIANTANRAATTGAWVAVDEP